MFDIIHSLCDCDSIRRRLPNAAGAVPGEDGSGQAGCMGKGGWRCWWQHPNPIWIQVMGVFGLAAARGCSVMRDCVAPGHCWEPVPREPEEFSPWVCAGGAGSPSTLLPV